MALDCIVLTLGERRSFTIQIVHRVPKFGPILLGKTKIKCQKQHENQMPMQHSRTHLGLGFFGIRCTPRVKKKKAVNYQQASRGCQRSDAQESEYSTSHSPLHKSPVMAECVFQTGQLSIPFLEPVLALTVGLFPRYIKMFNHKKAKQKSKNN